MSGSAALVSIVAPQAGHVCVAISLPAIVPIVTYRLDCHIDRVGGNRMAGERDPDKRHCDLERWIRRLLLPAARQAILSLCGVCLASGA